MDAVVNVVLCALLVTVCISGIVSIGAFWVIAFNRLFDGFIGSKPTDKEIADKTC